MSRWRFSADLFEVHNSAGLPWIKKHKLFLWKYLRELNGYYGVELSSERITGISFISSIH